MRVQIEDVTLDLGARQLFREGRERPLAPKAFDLLALLIDRGPRAVSKAEIRDHLWPRTFTSESNLSSLVAELRAALGDAARRPRFIRTLHGFGYAFCGNVNRSSAGGRPRSAAPLRWRLFFEDREIALSEGENILGRGEESVVSLESPTVSRRHARIVIADGQATVEDLGSKNGTYLGGERIRAAAPVKDRDEIRIGRVRLIFRVFSEATSTKTEAGG